MSTQQDRPPNVVLINCDDLGYGDIGCYGSEVNSTPAIDELAMRGLRMDAFYQPSPVCSPSRAGMLTGCYPPRVGFGSFDGLPVLFPGQPMGLDPSRATIPSVLRAAGYRTMMAGKWHCGDQAEFLPARHGFEEYFGLPYSNDMGRQVDAGTSWSFDWPPLPLLAGEDVIEQQPDQASLTERYLTEAVRFMRSHRDEPFLLYFAHMYVHLPIYVQDRFANASHNGTYGAAVECIDWSTAVLVHEIESLGLTEDTIVFFTSDNGSLARDGGSNAPLRGTKGTTWEGGMRVPGIVSWPGRIAPGRSTSELATAMDLLPTLAGLCGSQIHPDLAIDGIDLSGLWLEEGAGSPRDEMLYWWMNDLEAVRDSRFKLHFSKYGQPVDELYDLVEDPAETTDVLAQHPDRALELRDRAHRARAELGDARIGVSGTASRPAMRVDQPRLLTTYDPNHPYFMAEYDLADRG